VPATQSAPSTSLRRTSCAKRSFRRLSARFRLSSNHDRRNRRAWLPVSLYASTIAFQRSATTSLLFGGDQKTRARNLGHGPSSSEVRLSWCRSHEGRSQEHRRRIKEAQYAVSLFERPAASILACLRMTRNGPAQPPPARARDHLASLCGTRCMRAALWFKERLVLRRERDAKRRLISESEYQRSRVPARPPRHA
jgi:hypothetical protein